MIQLIVELAVQFNFYDHSKVILSASGLTITHIDKNYVLTHHRLTDVMAASMRSAPSDPVEAKFQARMVDKLRYCKEVLLSIKNASEKDKAGEA
jgi:cell cycle serine/threonine-protein kinase CDC5/MSD2